MLHSKKEVIDVEKDHDISKQVEFNAESPKQVQKDSPDQPIQKEEQEITKDVDAPQQLQQYSLIRDKERRQIKPPPITTIFFIF